MTTTNTSTGTEIEVDTTLVKLVTVYVQQELKARSQFFPMIDKAIDMMQKDQLDETKVRLQFRLAFGSALKQDWDKVKVNPEYVQFRLVANMIVHIATKAVAEPKWYSKQRKDGVGFYKMFEETKVTHDVDEDEKPARKSKPKAGSNTDESTDADDDTEEAPAKPDKQVLADKQWFGKCRLIVKHEPEAFIKMISNLIDRGQLPDVILEPISIHLRGE
jgi:hypothetical protein